MTSAPQLPERLGEVAVCLWFFLRADNVRTILSRVAAYRPRRLYLVCDGPHPDHPEQAAKVRAARLAASEAVTWPCEVRLDYSDVNLGVRRRIVTAIDWVFREEERAIFLEDDTIPAASFFPFCETMLDRYADDFRVMLVSGSNPLSGRVATPHGYLFSRFFHIWGWASWRRVWRLYDVDMKQWPSFKLNEALRSQYAHEGMIAWITRLFDGVHCGRIETWDVQLFFACLFNNGLAVVPGRNLVSNVGYDGVHYSGRNGDRMLGVPEEAISCRSLSHPRYISPSRLYDQLLMREFFSLPEVRRASGSLGAKLLHLGRRVLSPRRAHERDVLLAAGRGWLIHARAVLHGLPGNAFHQLGRAMGWRLWRQSDGEARAMLSCPVSSTRYFEFDFAWRSLCDGDVKPRDCLDVSSPFLFSFFAARRIPGLAVCMLNPDQRDIMRVTHLAKALRWRGVTTVAGGVETLDGLERQYDAIWSLSVVEHIADEHGEDREAVKRMWRALRPGGRLILTVPTDKQAWDEYRDRDHYGTQQLANAEGAHFFQRFYDAEAIRARICAAIGQAPAAMEWFGEKTPGHFHAYVARWLQAGQRATLRDPLDVAMNYRTYAQFADMPGAGVCGLLFIKP